MPRSQPDILRKQGLERHTDITDENFNPCFKEHTMSMDCIDENLGRREKCVLQFANYNACKRFWKEVIKTRQRGGIIPHLPAVEDRDSVKNYYQELWSKS